MKRAYQYRLYPNKAQQSSLDSLLYAGQQLYNCALEQRLLSWRCYRKTVSYLDQARDLKAIRSDLPEIGVLNFSACQQVLRRLDKVYWPFVRGERGRPRFKPRSRFRSLEFRFGDGARLTEGNRLHIQNVGAIKVRWHRSFPEGAQIKDLVVTRHSDGKWFVTFRLECPDPEPLEPNGPQVGVDVGLNSLVTTSDGITVDAPRFYRQTEERLKEAQRRHSSTRSKRAKREVQRLHAKTARQRKDVLHKLSHWLTQTYRLVAFEDLNVSSMTQGRRGMNKSIHDAGWSQLIQMCSYKADKAGSCTEKVDPSGTSQWCSGCGSLVPKSLSDRTHRCSSCGLVLDRDVNAACNILNRALGRGPACALARSSAPSGVG